MGMRQFINIAKALSDENRARVLMALRGGELCACQLIEMLGLSPSTVSKHMSILVQADLVECRKEGRWHYYRLAGAQSTHEWVAGMLAGDKRVAQDGAELRQICGKYAKSKQDCCRG